jgi:hypothetical protein
MGIRKSSGRELLGVAPYLHKWLHSCGGCGHVGHKPECPDSGPVFWKLKRCFPLLELNPVGLCVTCAHSVGRD